MPYRAMFSTIVTAGVALLGVAMWLWYIAPLVAATSPSPPSATVAASAPSTLPAHAAVADNPDRMLRGLVQGVLLLSFLLLCLLLIVGFAATFREWARYGSRQSLQHSPVAKTPYVDAWKIAGERMKVEDTASDEDS